MKRRLYKSLSGVALIALTTIMCTFSSSQNVSDPTTVAADVEKTIVSAKGTMEAEFEQAMNITAESAQAGGGVQEPQSPLSAQSGGIAGTLSYPSESIPPLRIVAFSSESDNWYFVIEQNAGTYEISDLPPGKYTVVAYLLNPEGNTIGGGYSRAVPCGLSVECADHTLIEVVVEAGKISEDINPGDWYAPEGSFPLDPTRP